MSIAAVASSQSLPDCMICFEVLVEPIELPCKHELCRSCFDDLSTSALIKFECPTCSRPLTDWYAPHRHNSSASLVNKERWLLIQRCFRDEVELRLGGRSAQVIAESIKNYNDHGIIDSVYARSVMSDFEFDRVMSEHRSEEAKPTDTTDNLFDDKFDIHEFLRKEREEEERASEKVIAELLKQDGLTVNDYAQMYTCTCKHRRDDAKPAHTTDKLLITDLHKIEERQSPPPVEKVVENDGEQQHAALTDNYLERLEELGNRIRETKLAWETRMLGLKAAGLL